MHLCRTESGRWRDSTRKRGPVLCGVGECQRMCQQTLPTPNHSTVLTCLLFLHGAVCYAIDETGIHGERGQVTIWDCSVGREEED